MGFFSKNSADFNIIMFSWKLGHVHARVILCEIIPFFLKNHGYTINEFDITDKESVNRWMKSNIANYNFVWTLNPEGSIQIKITTDPLKCKVGLSIPGISLEDIEKLPGYMLKFAELKFGSDMLEIKY